MSDSKTTDLKAEVRSLRDLLARAGDERQVHYDRAEHLREAMTEIMNDPRSGSWAEMRARCALAVAL